MYIHILYTCILHIKEEGENRATRAIELQFYVIELLLLCYGATGAIELCAGRAV